MAISCSRTLASISTRSLSRIRPNNTACIRHFHKTVPTFGGHVDMQKQYERKQSTSILYYNNLTPIPNLQKQENVKQQDKKNLKIQKKKHIPLPHRLKQANHIQNHRNVQLPLSSPEIQMQNSYYYTILNYVIYYILKDMLEKFMLSQKGL